MRQQYMLSDAVTARVNQKLEADIVADASLQRGGPLSLPVASPPALLYISNGQAIALENMAHFRLVIRQAYQALKYPPSLRLDRPMDIAIGDLAEFRGFIYRPKIVSDMLTR